MCRDNTFLKHVLFRSSRTVKTNRLLKPPVLYLPDNKGRYQLFSDTIKTSTGAAFYHFQGGKPNPIAYASKWVSEAAKTTLLLDLSLVH